MLRFVKTAAAALAGLLMMTGLATAAPITINFTGAVDQFNPGPFTSNVALSGQITLDDTVVATGPNNSFNNAITGFSLTISEPGGPYTYTNDGTGGRVQQLIGAGNTQFISVAFGGNAPGTFISPAGAPELTSFDIDFRGTDLFADPTVLATGLTEPDFSFAFMSTRFLTNGVSQLMVERRLDTATFSGERQTVAIPAPGAALILALGLIGLCGTARSRRV